MLNTDPLLLFFYCDLIFFMCTGGAQQKVNHSKNILYSIHSKYLTFKITPLTAVLVYVSPQRTTRRKPKSHLSNDCTSQNNFTVKGTASRKNNKYPLIVTKNCPNLQKSKKIVKILWSFSLTLEYPTPHICYRNVKEFGFSPKTQNKSPWFHKRKVDVSTSLNQKG